MREMLNKQCAAAGVFSTLQNNDDNATSVQVCEEHPTIVTVCVFMVLNECCQIHLLNKCRPPRFGCFHGKMQICGPTVCVGADPSPQGVLILFYTAAPARHCGVMNLKESRQNQDLHPNGVLCESHLFYDSTCFS